MQYRFILDLRFQAWCTMLGTSGSGVYPPPTAHPSPGRRGGNIDTLGKKERLGHFLKPFFDHFLPIFREKT